MDPRSILDEAAARRVACEIRPRRGTWTRGTVVRVEKGGLVITAPEVRMVGGEDVRVWLSIDGKAHTFEASVIRAGVPVPDRSQDGLLLGFIDRWTEGPREGAAAPGPGAPTIELLPPNGPGLSLFGGQARLVDLSADGLSFTVPGDFKLIFVEQGRLTVRLGAPGGAAVEVEAVVRTLTSGEGYLLYSLDFQQVADPDTFREVVQALG